MRIMTDTSVWSPLYVDGDVNGKFTVKILWRNKIT